MNDPAAGSPAPVPFSEAVRVWARVALLSFGGPAGQIAVMHRILVEEKKWIDERRFLHALNYCMVLPGPEAQQLATYIGWLLNRTFGGVVAGVLFVVPGFVSILALSVLYAQYQQSALIQAIFFGLKPAVIAIVLEALLRIGRRVLVNPLLVGYAAAAFTALFFFDVPFPLVILAAGVSGMVGGRLLPRLFVRPASAHGAGNGSAHEPPRSAVLLHAVQPSLMRSVRVALVCLVVWFGPVGLAALLSGPSSIYVQQGLFFSKAAVVTFGGAYSVLAYIAQQAVENYGWLRPGEMLDGLGMAETTPGPLIQVVQFVGFMGAFRAPGSFDALTAGVLGSLIATWVTFAPSFLWIFLGAPYIERLRDNKLVSAGLTAITAAVVGVILNLAVWFLLHTVFNTTTTQQYGALRVIVPDWATLDVGAVAIAVLALLLTFRWKHGMAVTLGASAAAGVGWHLLSR